MHRTAFAFAVLILVAGCKSAPDLNPEGGVDGGKPLTQPGSDAAPLGGGVPCGQKTCAPGQVCCNASCGICTPRGGMCIQMLCEHESEPAPGAVDCKTDADCRLVDDYCTGCDCRALGKSQPDPTCAGPGVRCLRAPCQGRVAACDQGKCVSRTATRDN